MLGKDRPNKRPRVTNCPGPAKTTTNNKPIHRETWGHFNLLPSHQRAEAPGSCRTSEAWPAARPCLWGRPTTKYEYGCQKAKVVHKETSFKVESKSKILEMIPSEIIRSGLISIILRFPLLMLSSITGTLMSQHLRHKVGEPPESAHFLFGAQKNNEKRHAHLPSTGAPGSGGLLRQALGGGPGLLGALAHLRHEVESKPIATKTVVTPEPCTVDLWRHQFMVNHIYGEPYLW